MENQYRKYLPTLSELIDRLSIIQLKEVFIPEHKEEYAQEIEDILYDISTLGMDSKLVRAIVVLSQMNLHIWHNESNYRKGIKDGNNWLKEFAYTSNCHKRQPSSTYNKKESLSFLQNKDHGEKA